MIHSRLSSIDSSTERGFRCTVVVCAPASDSFRGSYIHFLNMQETETGMKKVP
jgi:hypothetical protein